jgi:hypothetical protein
MARFSSSLLAVLAAAFLIGALWIGFRVVIFGVTEPSITIAALLATVAGLFLTAQRQMADRQEATSRFYLEQYQIGFDTAYEILDAAESGPYVRMKWIAAARVLATARAMFDRITVAAHRDVAQMSIPHQSQRFQRFFEMPDWYYYGAGPPLADPVAALDVVAKRSTVGAGSFVSTLQSVPERVIHTVYQAVAYPKNYKDVLGERFSEGDRLFQPEPLQRYLSHHEQWHSVAGVLHKRESGEKVE